MSESILVINTGSSSLKLGIYAPENGQEKILFSGSAEGLALEALDRAVEWLAKAGLGAPSAIGHRVVHGGPRLLRHQRITPAVLAELRACVHFAPLHIPAALQLIEKAAESCPEVPQFACFDTVFHRNMPETAARFPIPRQLFDEGVRRYGFHGISYESIVHQLGRSLPSRAVIAHLGSGASLVALKDGQSVDTTMAFTPTGGIPMATRSGDLDPGVLLYLLRVKQMSVASLEDTLNHASGLKALSGSTGDMRQLQAAADAGDPKAQLAMDVFCISIRKAIAAYAAVLGGLDLLVFTGGIGEHSARIRKGVCDGLEFLGIPRVEVLASQEDVQIARHCRVLLREKY